ncbi:MAG: DUF262 domain-containing protein [Lachnobacterium sp.]|nr:DUF262 domain-containing protein [Lachnobacterium sp.]
MNKTKLSWTVANIEKMHDEKKVLSFDHPIQRKSEQWSDTQKSLLIHSMLANYPVPNIYVLREDSQELDEKNKPVFNYFVMDGKQRLTSVLSYIWGEFPLDENIPAIIIEDVEYQIAGKYFCDLEEPVQYEIKRYKFDIIAFEECSNREIEEIFFRLNNSTPLTKSQVAKAKVGVEIAELINELLTSKFFTTSCNFSKAQLKASDDQKVLIQSMMLLDTNNVLDFELKDFSENSILEYSESIRGTYTDKQSNILKSAIQYLTDAFPEKNKQLRKISIPTLVYMADIAEDKEIKPMYFRQWFEFFTEEDELMEDYKTFCSTGSTKLEKVQGRLAVMTKSFCKYHEIEIPEELKDMVADVEEKLAAKKASEEMLIDDVMENPSEEMQGNTEDEMPVEEFPGNTEERNLDVDKEETSDPSECNSDGSETSPENNSLHDAV